MTVDRDRFIQEYVLRSEFSQDKTTVKKTFFNLKKLRSNSSEQEGDLRDDQVKEISKRLEVDQKKLLI